MRHTVLAFVALSVTLAPSRPSFERPASLVHVEASRMSMACLYAIDAYAKTDRETLIGRVQFNDRGDNANFVHRMGQHQDGKIAIVWPSDAATGKMNFPGVPW